MSFRLVHDADPMPHLPIELGRAGEGVGRWVPEMKHTFLAKYVEGTRRAMEKFKQRVYVDLFCGPGRIQVKGETMTRPGGAQVAWQHSLRDDIAFTSCLVGDLDAARAAACAERLRGMGAPGVAFPGAAESTVDQVLGQIPKSALCLAYLDPYNLQYLSFNVIEKLARLPYVDFAVHFSTMDLRRNILMEYNPDRARFDDAAPGWRQHVDPLAFVRGDADEEFFDYWCGLVKKLGFSISHRMPLVRDDGNLPLYHLPESVTSIPASRHARPTAAPN